jgi:hypothetical protein
VNVGQFAAHRVGYDEGVQIGSAQATVQAIETYGHGNSFPYNALGIGLGEGIEIYPCRQRPFPVDGRGNL